MNALIRRLGDGISFGVVSGGRVVERAAGDRAFTAIGGLVPQPLGDAGG
jgi:hypothetical protein